VLTSSIGLFIEIGGWEEVEDGDEKFDGERARWHRWQVEGEPGGVSACDATAEAKEAAKEREKVRSKEQKRSRELETEKTL
jgi:hypothetical protein